MNSYYKNKNKNKDTRAQIAWQSIYPIQSTDIYNFLKIDKDDLIISIFAFTTTILTWIAFKYYSRSFSNIFLFWDSSDPVIYLKITSEKGKGDIISENYNGRSYKDVLNPLPVQRLILWILHIFTFGQYQLAQLLYTLIFSILSSLIFKRFLIAYKIAKIPLYSTLLFCLFPVRFAFYRNIPTYDTLFLSLILLSFIFYRYDFHFSLIAVVTLATFTKFEGFILFIVYLILYALRTDVNSIISIGVATFIVFLIINIRYPNYSKFIIPMSELRNGRINDSFEMKPFFYYFNLRRSISNLRAIHALEMIYFPCIFGSCILLFESLPLSFFCFAYTIFLSFIQSSDIHRFAIPVHVISILAGLDFFLSTPAIKFAITCLSPFFFLGELYYCGNQISSRSLSYGVWSKL